MKLYLKNLFCLSTLDATGADPALPDSFLRLDANLLKIGKPAPFRKIMGVAHRVPGHGLLSTYNAFLAHRYPPYIDKRFYNVDDITGICKCFYGKTG
jgi:hypothetical protein